MHKMFFEKSVLKQLKKCHFRNDFSYLKDVHFCWVVVLSFWIFSDDEDEDVVVQLLGVFAGEGGWFSDQLHWELLYDVLE